MKNVNATILSILVIFVVLFVASIFWERSSGENNKFDHRMLLVVAFTRILCLLGVFVSVFAYGRLFFHAKEEPLNKQIYVYAYAEGKEPSTYDSADCVTDLRNQFSVDYNDSKYYDRIKITVLPKEATVADTIRALISSDIYYVYTVDAEYTPMTEKVNHSGELIRTEDGGSLLSGIGDLTFVDGDLAEYQDGTYIKATAILDSSQIGNEITDYKLLECAIKEDKE